jgi:signal transduction histidine kinase
MTRWTLRRRLNTVVLQWFLLFGGVAGAALLISIPGIRRMLVDDRVLLARTIAQSLDATLSTAVQDLGRLAADLPDHPAGDAAARLHIFRLSSPFAESTYVLDHDGQMVAADPPGARPLPEAWLGYHESVTPLVLGVGPESRPVLAMVEPFTRGADEYYLVSEMNPIGSTISAFLRDLEPELDMHVVVVDEHGAVVASNDPTQLYRRLSNANAYRERIGAHRPLVIEDARCEFEPAGSAPPVLMVMVPLRFAPWGVVIEQHKTAALAGVYTLWRWLGLSGVLLAAMAVLLARALSRSVVSPIRALSRDAEAMRSGDLSTPIAAAGDVEIEVLAKTLDEARGRLASTLGELTTFNVHLEAQVAARTAKLAAQDEQRKVLVRRLLGATEDERRRLARELHDEISQLLTVIQLSLDRVDVDPSEMTRARDLLTRTQREIHGIIHDLRPSLLDDLGLSAAIRSHVQDHLRSQGLEVSVEIDEALPQRPATDTVVFRIFQELVTNILRHAQAEHVSIELYERDGKRVLEVEDDGAGFDPDAKSEGAGVLGMRERAALVDGVIRFDSEPDLGTHVVLEIPIQ